jgi:hypothetical protein
VKVKFPSSLASRGVRLVEWDLGFVGRYGHVQIDVYGMYIPFLRMNSHTALSR